MHCVAELHHPVSEEQCVADDDNHPADDGDWSRVHRYVSFSG